VIAAIAYSSYVYLKKADIFKIYSMQPLSSRSTPNWCSIWFSLCEQMNSFSHAFSQKIVVEWFKMCKHYHRETSGHWKCMNNEKKMPNNLENISHNAQQKPSIFLHMKCKRRSTLATCASQNDSENFRLSFTFSKRSVKHQPKTNTNHWSCFRRGTFTENKIVNNQSTILIKLSKK
jgi:hypothetical protein